ncbi:hypothetical protein CEXT_794841 [Caerostris extrusa]|uniref:Uncharacterized protein n=1 Tax=Caerostris extrusa TaxID=172846 RepID=A0AAV4Q5X3_CAEEX|nr:hypothetical protein CEXT_794841 [Caerostris extrusa]
MNQFNEGTRQWNNEKWVYNEVQVGSPKAKSRIDPQDVMGLEFSESLIKICNLSAGFEVSNFSSPFGGVKRQSLNYCFLLILVSSSNPKEFCFLDLEKFGKVPVLFFIYR